MRKNVYYFLTITFKVKILKNNKQLNINYYIKFMFNILIITILYVDIYYDISMMSIYKDCHRFITFNFLRNFKNVCNN